MVIRSVWIGCGIAWLAACGTAPAEPPTPAAEPLRPRMLRFELEDRADVDVVLRACPPADRPEAPDAIRLAIRDDECLGRVFETIEGPLEDALNEGGYRTYEMLIDHEAEGVSGSRVTFLNRPVTVAALAAGAAREARLALWLEDIPFGSVASRRTRIDVPRRFEARARDVIAAGRCPRAAPVDFVSWSGAVPVRRRRTVVDARRDLFDVVARVRREGRSPDVVEIALRRDAFFVDEFTVWDDDESVRRLGYRSIDSLRRIPGLDDTIVVSVFRHGVEVACSAGNDTGTIARALECAGLPFSFSLSMGVYTNVPGRLVDRAIDVLRLSPRTRKCVHGWERLTDERRRWPSSRW